MADEENRHRRSVEAAEIAKSLRERIRAEIASLGPHDWAGEYFSGDGLSNHYLSVAPKAGYVYEWQADIGLFDRNYGAVKDINDTLALTFTVATEEDKFDWIAPKMAIVRWGQRRYLVPSTSADADQSKFLVSSSSIIGFCNEINQGAEPRDEIYGWHLIRIGDEKTAVTALPQLPREFQAYLLATPIQATIVEIGSSITYPSTADLLRENPQPPWDKALEKGLISEWRPKDTTLTLDVGSERGLRVGMELLVSEPAELVQSLRVTRVEPRRAEAVMNQNRDTEPSPAVGWRVSTRAPWRD